MSRPTVVVSPESLAGERLEVDGDTFRHLFRSRRLGVGDPLRAVDGRGTARLAEVLSVGRRRAVIALGESAASSEPSVPVELWVGVPRPRRAAWLVEKVTEVGVVALRWLDTAHGGRDLPDAALERHRRIALAAVEQCGRAVVPEISGLHPWDDLVAALDRPGSTLVFDRTEPAIAEAFGHPDRRGSDPVRLVVGPEGGLRADEITELERRGAERLGLGERTLRVETAAVVAVALVLCPPRPPREEDR